MSSDASGSRWFYIQGGRRQGPVDLPRLVEILRSGALPVRLKPVPVSEVTVGPGQAR